MKFRLLDGFRGGRRSHLATPLLLLALSLLLALGGDGLMELGRYERGALAAGELWRLISGHLVHLSWGHFVMNAAALVLLTLLFEDSLKPLDWVLTCVMAVLAIDAGLYWLAPEIDWYVGLSGLLHGLLLTGSLRLVARRSWLGVVLLLGLLMKLGWERAYGPVPFSEATAGGGVIIAAHWYGALGGGMAAVLAAAIRRLRRARL